MTPERLRSGLASLCVLVAGAACLAVLVGGSPYCWPLALAAAVGGTAAFISWRSDRPRPHDPEADLDQGTSNFRVPPVRPLLGELLVRKYRLLSELQLDQALREQKGTKKLLGAILVEKGLITPSQLQMALTDQRLSGRVWLS